MLVYQSRNAPAWGRARPHAFGYRADELPDEGGWDEVLGTTPPPGEPTAVELAVLAAETAAAEEAGGDGDDGRVVDVTVLEHERSRAH